MSSVDRLVRELCPGGVEYVPLGEIAELKRGTSISKKDIEPGEIPVVAGGITPAYFTNQSNREGPVIVVAGSGANAGYVSFWEEPVFVSDAFSIQAAKGVLNARYIYHALKAKQKQLHALKRGGGVPHVYAKDAAQIVIPLPPLKAQEKIVQILDRFTDLDRELQAEITGRESQLTSLIEDLKHVTAEDSQPLRAIADRCKGMAITAAKMKELAETPGELRIFAGGQTMVDVDASLVPQDKIHSGPAIVVKSRGYIDFAFHEDLYTHKNEMWSYHVRPENAHSKYVYYYLLSQKSTLQEVARATSVKLPQLGVRDTDGLKIPLPPLEVQREIAAKLDAFTEYIDNLKRERELRQKQYEHYRDQLLNFPVKA